MKIIAKLRVEGKVHQVGPFMTDLNHHSKINFHQKETQMDEDHVCITCDIDLQPFRRVKIVKFLREGKVIITMPLLDLVVAEIEEGKTILAGKSFDIFSG